MTIAMCKGSIRTLKHFMYIIKIKHQYSRVELSLILNWAVSRILLLKKEKEKNTYNCTPSFVLPKVTSQFCLDFNSTLLCMVIKNNQHFCSLVHNFKDLRFDFVQKEKVRVKNLFLERSFLEEGGHGKIYYGGRN